MVGPSYTKGKEGESKGGVDVRRVKPKDISLWAEKRFTTTKSQSLIKCFKRRSREVGYTAGRCGGGAAERDLFLGSDKIGEGLHRPRDTGKDRNGELREGEWKRERWRETTYER